MIGLDLITVIKTYVLVNYTCALILGLAWYRIKNKYRGIFFVFLDFIFQSIGLTLASLQTVISPVFSVILANSLMYVGAILLLLGFGRFIDVRVDYRPYIPASLLFVVLYGVFTLVIPDTGIRLIIFTGMTVQVFLHTLYIGLKKADDNHRKFAVHVIIAHVLLTAVHGSRALIGLNKVRTIDYSSLHPTEARLILASLILMIYLTFAVIQMIHMKILHQLDASIERTKDLLEKTQTLADIDTLTKIFNRGKIEEILKKEITDFQTHGQPFCIMMADIDHFKRFNDVYGHDFGDYILTEVSGLLKRNLRATDSIGRWGGEEFLIILRNTNIYNAQAVGQELIGLTGAFILENDGVTEQVTISIGCAEVKKTDTLNSLVKKADIEMYKAKLNGRDRIEISIG